MKKVFRIRRKSDGKFAIPGEYTKYSRTGKLFVDEVRIIRGIAGHLGDFKEIMEGRSPFCDFRKEELEIVEYILTEVSATPFSEWELKVGKHRDDKTKELNNKVEREQMRVFGEVF